MAQVCTTAASTNTCTNIAGLFSFCSEGIGYLK